MSFDARITTPTGPRHTSHEVDLSTAFEVDGGLPEPLPGDPLPLFRAWFDEAHQRKIAPNPNAMSIATVDADGTISNRIVLCRGIDLERGFIVFYTNRESRKGRALEQNQRIAACFHWDVFDRQVRIEGRVTRSPDAESDHYFAGRGTAKSLAAWSSEQSAPIGSRGELLDRVKRTLERFGYDPGTGDATKDALPVPRPPHWGGYRIWISAIELWKGNNSRMHDRAEWRRELRPAACDGVQGYEGSAWTGTRLQP
ncbi:MAG: pyridoxamine 5'-phosphate oxidase [Phycisphaerales bacterium]